MREAPDKLNSQAIWTSAPFCDVARRASDGQPVPLSTHACISYPEQLENPVPMSCVRDSYETRDIIPVTLETDPPNRVTALTRDGRPRHRPGSG